MAVAVEVKQRNVEVFDIILKAAPELRLTVMTKCKDGTDGILVGRRRVFVEPVLLYHLTDPFEIFVHSLSVVGINVIGFLAHKVGTNEKDSPMVEGKVLPPRRLSLNSRGQCRRTVPVHLHSPKAVHPVAPARRWVGTVIPGKFGWGTKK